MSYQADKRIQRMEEKNTEYRKAKKKLNVCLSAAYIEYVHGKKLSTR